MSQRTSDAGTDSQEPGSGGVGASGGRPSGPGRRRFLQWSDVGGAGAAVAAAFPAGSAAASPGVAAAASLPRVTAFDPIRPEAVLLAVRSPYLSTWLDTSNLPGTWPSFWTGRTTAMAGIAMIDGTSYVFLGNTSLPDSPPFPIMRQTGLETTSTRSTFTLEQAGVRLVVQFLSPVPWRPDGHSGPEQAAVDQRPLPGLRLRRRPRPCGRHGRRSGGRQHRPRPRPGAQLPGHRPAPAVDELLPVLAGDGRGVPRRLHRRGDPRGRVGEEDQAGRDEGRRAALLRAVRGGVAPGLRRDRARWPA